MKSRKTFFRERYLDFIEQSFLRIKRNNLGFTLAEVLITLGIIGVVVALTMPSLIANYQKQETIARLKKVYSTISNTYMYAINSYGTSDTWDWNDKQVLFDKYFLPLFPSAKVFNSNCAWGACFCVATTDKKIWAANLEHEYKWPGGQKITSPIPSDTPSIQFPDGACVIIDKETIWIDINGAYKLPNVVGKDLFAIGVNERGGIEPYKPYGDTCDEDLKKQTNGSGLECATRIIEDGWQINYPW